MGYRDIAYDKSNNEALKNKIGSFQCCIIKVCIIKPKGCFYQELQLESLRD